MTYKYILLVCACLLIGACGGETTTEAAENDGEHFLSDHQRALESADAAAGAIEAAAQRAADQVEELEEND